MDQQRLALFRPFSAGSLKKFYRLIIIWKAKKRKKKNMKNGELCDQKRSDTIGLHMGIQDTGEFGDLQRWIR